MVQLELCNDEKIIFLHFRGSKKWREQEIAISDRRLQISNREKYGCSKFNFALKFHQKI